MNRNLPYISVIVPVYNDQMGINACLESLTKQSYPPDRYEIIIVDNQSKPQIVINDSLFKNTKLILCPVKGSYAARNAGVKTAKGDILAFTDADCQPDQEWIMKGIGTIQSSPKQCFVGGDVKMVLSEKPTSVELYQSLTGFMQKQNVELLGFSATANLFTPMDIFSKIGMFNEKLLSGGDREWSWRARAAGYEIKYAEDAFVVTSPRRTISSAVRQAFRVAGGRYGLRRMNSSHVKESSIKPHRSPVEAMRWILMHPHLKAVDRFRILWVAILIKFSGIIETFRLKFLGKQLNR
jgi:glycosyltransferase involved in cell wall biosynthesis